MGGHAPQRGDTHHQIVGPAGLPTTGNASNDCTPAASTISFDAVSADAANWRADVQSLINSAPDISIHVEGVNEVDGKPIVFKGYKAKLGVAQNVSLIGDDFGTLQVSLTFQKDETIVTAGKSQYFELQQAA